MNNIINRLGNIGLVPLVVIEDANKAVSAAKALLAGGIDCMEITLRTTAAMDAIKAVKKAYPKMLIGAGTVLSIDMARQAVDAGCEFLVAPGLNPELVTWCNQQDIPIMPGCVTPTEIEAALKLSLRVLKFFPANVYGGVNGCKALYGPYRMVSFIPTGGINLNNLADYADKQYIHAIGGSWLCTSGDIASENYDAITKSASESIKILLGFDPDNNADEVTTHNMDRAVYYLQKRGYSITKKMDGCNSSVLENEKSDATIIVKTVENGE